MADSKENDSREKYRILAGYHASERQIFVSRSQVFVFTSTALIAFTARHLPKIGPSASWSDIATSAIGVTLGFGLWVGWRSAISAGNWWIRRLRDAMLTCEQEALGDSKVFRDVKGSESEDVRDRNDKAGDIWRFLLRFFLVLWLSIGGWVLVTAIVKFIAVPPTPSQILFNFDRIAICVLVSVLIFTFAWLWRAVRKIEAVVHSIEDKGQSAVDQPS